MGLTSWTDGDKHPPIHLELVNQGLWDGRWGRSDCSATLSNELVSIQAKKTRTMNHIKGCSPLSDSHRINDRDSTHALRWENPNARHQ